MTPRAIDGAAVVRDIRAAAGLIRLTIFNDVAPSARLNDAVRRLEAVESGLQSGTYDAKPESGPR